ncbi:hypothetical protein [Kordia sp.]|uniref:hypothetical protein n=1 Tax=Kordia sp. TaxID=1965332 RepID=UPI003B5B4D95
MKKKDLSLLKLRKKSISNLNDLKAINGMGDSEEVYTTSCVETEMTYCETCPTMGDITGCITNDKTQSLRPTIGIACNALNTNDNC